MKVLFVCTENVARSRAAETLFRELQGGVGRHEVRSVGTASHAARRITTRDLAWADVIAVMESRHLNAIRRHWPHHVEKVMVLEILDFFLPKSRKSWSWRFSTSSYRMKSSFGKRCSRRFVSCWNGATAWPRAGRLKAFLACDYA